jgi:hypothetical protein
MLDSRPRYFVAARIAEDDHIGILDLDVREFPETHEGQ